MPPVETAPPDTAAPPSPWLTVPEAAARAKCGINLIYEKVRKGKLRAVKLGARKDIRIHITWLDAWMESAATDAELVNPDAPGAAIPFRR